MSPRCGERPIFLKNNECIVRFRRFLCLSLVWVQFAAERCIYTYGIVYVVWSSLQTARIKTGSLIIPPALPFHMKQYCIPCRSLCDGYAYPQKYPKLSGRVAWDPLLIISSTEEHQNRVNRNTFQFEIPWRYDGTGMLVSTSPAPYSICTPTKRVPNV